MYYSVPLVGGRNPKYPLSNPSGMQQDSREDQPSEARAAQRAPDVKAVAGPEQLAPELLRAALEYMDDSVIIVASDGRVLYANPAAQRSRPLELTKPARSLTGHGMFRADGVTPLSFETLPSTCALAGETIVGAEVVRRVPGLGEQSFRVNASPIRDASGAILGAVCVGHENTRARNSRRALMHSEALFRTVVRNLPNGAVLLFDHDLRYLMADGDALLNSVGLTSAALVGKTLTEVATPEHLEAITARYRAALAGEVQSFETVRGDKTYALDIVPVRDAHGEINAGMALIYDVSRHKHTEQALLEQTLLVNEEAANVELLQSIAAAANTAQTAQEAFKICL